jgi:hypothetical protein
MLLLWIGTAVVSVAAVLALILVVLAKRADQTRDLGSVSHHWIAAHRANSS